MPRNIGLPGHPLILSFGLGAEGGGGGGVGGGGRGGWSGCTVEAHNPQRSTMFVMFTIVSSS